MKKISEKTKQVLKAIGRILCKLIGLKWPKLGETGEEIIDVLKVPESPIPEEPQKKSLVATKEEQDQEIFQELTERRGIENTPFMCIRYEENWILTLGKYRILEEEFESFEDIVEYVDLHKWNIILIISSIAVQATLTELKKD